MQKYIHMVLAACHEGRLEGSEIKQAKFSHFVVVSNAVTWCAQNVDEDDCHLKGEEGKKEKET